MVKIHQHVKFQAIPSMRSPANAQKPLRTDGRTDGWTDGHAVKRSRLVGWTNGPMYRSKEGISGFGRTDGQKDGQPENIMPPAPKGGGIKKHQSSASLAFVCGIHRDRWIPHTNASYAESVSIWWRHHGFMYFLQATTRTNVDLSSIWLYTDMDLEFQCFCMIDMSGTWNIIQQMNTVVDCMSRLTDYHYPN